MSKRPHLCLLPFAICLLTFFAACHTRPAPPRSYLAFVANHDSNSVAVVDLGTFRVIASIPVARGPEQVAVRPGSQEVWALSDSGMLSVIQYPELRVTKTVRLGGSTRDLLFSPDGRSYFVLVTDRAGKSRIIFGDGATGQRLPGGSCCMAQHTPGTTRTPGRASRLRGNHKEYGGSRNPYRFTSLALSPDSKTLVAADTASDRLVFIGAESRQVLGTVEVGKAPGPMVILPDGSKVFVADTGENKISAVDLTSRQLLSNIELSSKPSFLALKPDGGELFVSSAEASLVTIVDAFHDDVETSSPAGSRPVAAVFRKDSSVMYTANAGDGSVTAYDIQNRELLNSTHAGIQPEALALTPDQRFLIVADVASSSIAVLRADPEEKDRKGNPYLAPNRSALVTTVPVGARPISIVIPNFTSLPSQPQSGR